MLEQQVSEIKSEGQHILMRTFLYRIIIGFFFLTHVALASPSLQITGVTGDVLDNIKSRINELYENESLAQDTREKIQHQIEQAMYPYGYFKPRVRILSVKKSYLNVHINPGPQLKITSLSLQITGEGAKNPKLIKALHAVDLKAGQPLITPNYNTAKDSLLNAAEHEGFLHASFDTSRIEIDRTRYTANIILVFNTGLRYYFGPVQFDKTYLNNSLLYRYLPFQPGQPYSTDEVLALESNLSASGYFKSVVVKPHINDHRAVPLTVHLEPVHRINYSLGVGYGTDTGPRGRASFHVIPVNRQGHIFRAIGQGSAKQNALVAQYTIPGRNPVTDKYALTGSLTNQDFVSGYGNAFLLSLAKQHTTKTFQSVFSLNALSERYNYNYIGIQKQTTSLLYPQATFTWNKTTDPLFSPSGYNISLSGLAATRAVLSDIDVGQAIVDAKAAFTLDFIRTRFFAHAIQGVTPTKDINQVPLSLAMLLGGAENMRGYSFNSIGPGKIMTYGGLEIQKETVDKWYVIGFVDAGDVYQPLPRNFKYNVGLGLMWVSPVGPIKIGVAQPVNNRFQRIKSRDPRLVINMGPDL